MWNKCTPVAIKTLKPGTMQPGEFLKEAAIMKRLHHPRLVALYAVCSQDEPILIITELMNGGSLLDCLRNDRGRTITWTKLIDFAAQVGTLLAVVTIGTAVYLPGQFSLLLLLALLNVTKAMQSPPKFKEIVYVSVAEISTSTHMHDAIQIYGIF